MGAVNSLPGTCFLACGNFDGPRDKIGLESATATRQDVVKALERIGQHESALEPLSLRTNTDN